MLRVATVLAAAAVAAAAVSSDSDPSYDHQTQPYVPDHTPVTTTGKLNLRAFFSPDWSVATYIELIQSALPGTTLYIGAPGFDSWNFCTYTVDDDFYGQCDGCTVEKQAAETFPVFPAILNAVHQRGVTVNILTNNYNTPTCRGYIAPLDFLSLNGVNIKYYDSTTFMHAKYVHVNGNTTSVSSVNFSWTSFNKNREAGIIMSGKDAAPLMDMMHAVFEDDFAQATPYVVNQTYSSEEMAVITSKKAYPVVAPPKQTFPNNYVTPPPVPLPGTSTVTAFASPDSSLKTLLADVEGASTSFQLYMYQITDPTLCTLMQKLSARGVNVTLMVSAKIYDASDSASAHACYDQLLEGGMSVRLSPAYYTYSHQKYWIVDGVRMGLSTGNWSPTDYPPVQTAAGNYPAYGSPGWQRVNRDFNLLVEDSASLVSIFATTLAEDHARGSWYSSGTSLYRPA